MKLLYTVPKLLQRMTEANLLLRVALNSKILKNEQKKINYTFIPPGIINSS